MPYRPQQNYKSQGEKVLEVPNPAMGGLNLKDLEFEQEVNQSPYMLNAMYRNGAFGKRYGQEIHSNYEGTIYSMVYYDGNIFVHSGTKIFKNTGGLIVPVATSMPEESGMFIVYAQKLYYLISSGFYVYSNGAFGDVDGYVPDFLINCEPDGSHADPLDELNLMSDKFSYIYNADGTAVYDVGVYDSENIIDWNEPIIIEVDDEPTTAFTVDSSTKKITFNTAPQEGSLNVKMTFTMVEGTFSTERGQILSCKFYDTFGGSNNSRLFVAGCGYSKYFYTQAYDISYFPESNFATLGNTEDDITGFGRQYNVLIVFKPREVYSIYSYTETSSTTVMEEQLGMEAFRSQLVNASIGCDAPHSIQLINNLLTWFNSNEGVCTLVSTNIQDERNVRVISRNIERTNNFGVKGILDYNEDLDTIQSVDYNNKYFLVFPQSGMCFMWDYEIQPYVVTSRGDTDPRKLDWFLFDHFYCKQFLKAGKQLLYSSTFDNSTTITVTNLVPGELNSHDGWTFVDVDSYRIWNNQYRLNFEDVSSGQIMSAPITLDPTHTYYISVDIENHSETTALVSLVGMRYITIPSNGVMTRRSNYIRPVSTMGTFNVTLNRPYGYIIFRNPLLIDMTASCGDDIPSLNDFDKIVGESYEINDPHTIVYGSDFTKNIIKLNASFEDLDFDGDGKPDPIHCYYMTPFMQFGAVEMLKDVSNIYVQCRGDTSTLINLGYYTDVTTEPYQEPHSIETGGKGTLWNNFTWDSFRWGINAWGTTFRRRCNLRHIQMASILFTNDEVGKDMSITHIGFQYSMIKYVR